MGNRIMFIADAHLKGRTWTNNVALAGDSYQALRMLGMEATMQGDFTTDTVVLVGDTFDSNRPSAADVQVLQEALGEVEHLYFITGNHDSAFPPWVQVALPNSVNLVDEVVLRRKVHMFGIDYTATREDTISSLKVTADNCRERGIDKCIIVMHTGVKEFLGFNETYTVSVDDISEIMDGIQTLVVVGHVHRRGTVERPGLIVHSPGSTYPLNVDEMNTGCAATVVELDNEGKFVLKDVPVEVRAYCQIEYDGDAAALADTITKLAGVSDDQYGRMPKYIRVVVDDDADIPKIPDTPDIVQFIRKKAVAVETKTAYVHVDSIEDAIKEAAGDDSDCASMAVELFNSDDPLKTVHEWVDFWGAEWAKK